MLTFEEADRLFSYDALTGDVCWKIRKARCVRVGVPIRGKPNKKGHRFVNIGKQELALHRIAWTLVYGEWPTRNIRHVNGDKFDNRLSNLALIESHKLLLSELLDYHPGTGEFYWKVDQAQTVKAGDRAATRKNNAGYVHIRINGRSIKAHRLAWQIYYGDPLDFQIDHINGDRSDNRIENLRLATHGQNQQNAKLQINNTSGVKGVYAFNAMWVAQINANGKRHYLGRFDTVEAAKLARRDAAVRLHGEFAREA